MAHGIEAEDKGYVWGTTWHGLEQYVQLDRPVTFLEARSVMDYEIEKRSLWGYDEEEDEFIERDAWEVVRSDTGKVLIPHVGARFTVMNNVELLDFVDAALLSQYEGLEIESVGTLFGGATAFVNIKLEEHQIKGDNSPTISRLMYYNPLGAGSYAACAHTIRVVCNNTLRMATAQGAANNSLKKFRHTASAASRISEYMVDLAEIWAGLKKHKHNMKILAKKDVNEELFDNYFTFLFPAEKEEGRGATMAANKRAAVEHIFNSDQDLSPAIQFSRYGLLQATTNYFDHLDPRKADDEATVAWNGLVGNYSDMKDKAVKFLLTA
jgi:phage/plasmid-like protein (TIGR03299 family)